MTFKYKTNVSKNLLLAVIVISSLLLPFNTASTKTAKEPPKKQPVLEPATQSQYEELNQSLIKAILNEKALLEEIVRKKEELNQLEVVHIREISSIKLQLSASSNLISLSDAHVEDMEKAQASLRQILETVAIRIKELTEEKGDVDQKLKVLDEQKAINEKQIEDIRAHTAALHPLLRKTESQLREISSLFQQKEKYLNDIRGKIDKLIAEWSQIQEETSTILHKMEVRIAERKKEELFRRSKNPLTALGMKEIREEFEELGSFVGRLLTINFWKERIGFIWSSGRVLLVTSLVVFIIVECTLLWARKRFKKYITETTKIEKGWLWIALQLAIWSLPVAGATVFIYGYGLARNLYDTFPPLKLLVLVLLLWLFSSWIIHFIKLIKERLYEEAVSLILRRLRTFISVGRWFILAYLCFQEILGRSSSLLLIYRFFLEIFLLGWVMAFARFIRRNILTKPFPDFPRFHVLIKVFIGWLHGIAIVGILLELAGYSFLAILWYLGWGRTAVVGLWGFIFFMVLREWEKVADKDFELSEYSDTVTRSSFEWLIVRLLWVVWLFACIIGVLIAWGAKQAIIFTLFKILNTPIPIGSFSFRLSGLFYAALILAITHVGTKLLKHVLRHRILHNSGLEMGLQESIITISGYALWFFGALAALNALGFSGTSLTVAFGALGVGLGFGLQNIFNNFVSGLILLFERPIQVGDAIEIDGVWGEVKKINFRSTVIQTWDNASLIIPNSEFISGRVTNWSFKDLRIRSNIDIGVAYGSDVELVKKTLLEIANNHPNVLKSPEPSVLFLNFGDSSLTFRLRVWTLIHLRLQVETDIRFEIYRLFNERKIEIPFPQRDIHIRSIVTDASQLKKG